MGYVISVLIIALVIIFFIVTAKYGYVIGKPKEYPEALVEALKKLYDELGYIQSAFLALIFRKSDGLPQHLIIGINVNAEKFEEASEKTEQIFKSIKTGEVFEIVNMRDKKNSGLLKSMNSFYSK